MNSFEKTKLSVGQLTMQSRETWWLWRSHLGVGFLCIGMVWVTSPVSCIGPSWKVWFGLGWLLGLLPLWN